jgi:hypothetical protein
MRQAQRSSEMRTQFRFENLKGRDLLEERNRWEDNKKMYSDILYIIGRCGLDSSGST